MHDQTAVRTEAPPTCSSSFPRSRPRSTPGTAWDAARHQQSPERICVEHASAGHQQWRTLQRFPGRREDFDETYMAVAGLVSDRAAER
jgi:hypothetical protein